MMGGGNPRKNRGSPSRHGNLLSGFQLLRLKSVGVIMHATTSAALIVYDLSIGFFWVSGGPVGMSVGAATGVGNMGIVPFQCFN